MNTILHGLYSLIPLAQLALLIAVLSTIAWLNDVYNNRKSKAENAHVEARRP